MKKVITICLLVITLFLGGSTVMAQTAKKDSKSNTTQTNKNDISLTIEPFLRCENPQYKIYWYKNLSEIETEMKNLGYEDIGEEFGGYYESEDGEMEPLTTIGFQKGSTEVYIYVNEDSDWIKYIGIKFGSSTEQSEFIKAAKNKSQGTNISVWQEYEMIFIGISEH